MADYSQIHKYPVDLPRSENRFIKKTISKKTFSKEPVFKKIKLDKMKFKPYMEGSATKQMG